MSLLVLIPSRNLCPKQTCIDLKQQKDNQFTMNIEMCITSMGTIIQWQLMMDFSRGQEEMRDLLFLHALSLLDHRNLQLFGAETAELIGRISIFAFLFCSSQVFQEYHL